MDRARVTQLLEDLADGRLALASVAGLNLAELKNIEQLALTAFQQKKYADSERIFGFLEQLEPDKPAHSLHRAHAAAAIGNVSGAVTALTRFLANRKKETPDNIARALLFRARLLAQKDPDQAKK